MCKSTGDDCPRCGSSITVPGEIPGRRINRPDPFRPNGIRWIILAWSYCSLTPAREFHACLVQRFVSPYPAAACFRRYGLGG